LYLLHLTVMNVFSGAYLPLIYLLCEMYFYILCSRIFFNVGVWEFFKYSRFLCQIWDSLIFFLSL
jgi:hypothetical protein